MVTKNIFQMLGIPSEYLDKLETKKREEKSHKEIDQTKRRNNEQVRCVWNLESEG